jgi:hypothetical protein
LSFCPQAKKAEVSFSPDHFCPFAPLYYKGEVAV